MKFNSRKIIANLLILLCCTLTINVGQAFALKFVDDFGEKTGLKDARKRLTAGPLKLHPYVVQQMSYDSNVFLEPNDRKDDVIWVTTPGIIADLNLGDHLIEVDYRCDFENFTKFSDQNDQNQYFKALVDLSFPDWYVNAEHRLAQTSSRAGTTFTQRIGRLENTTQTTIGYKWNQLQAELDYHLFNRTFNSSTYKQWDYNVNRIGTTLFFELTKKTQAFVEYAHGFIVYRNNRDRDGNFDRVRGGLKGQLLPRLTTITKMGWESRRYRGKNEAGFNGFSAEMAFRYAATSRTAVETGLYHGPEEATFLDVANYTESRMFARLEQKLWTSMLFTTDLSYARQEYDQRTLIAGSWGKRVDDLFRIDTALKYDFKEWWTFSVGYRFAFRNSKFDSFDYKDNVFYVNTGIHL